MYDGIKHIEESYSFRLLLSFICATLIAVFSALLLPEEIEIGQLNSPNVKNIRFEYIDLSRYFKNKAYGEGGGGGGGPAVKETKAGVRASVPLLSNLATPIASNKQDSSMVPEINIPTKDNGSGIGTGEGSGIGTGIGSGMGGGVGNGIGNGTGDGIEAVIIPPRPLLLVVPEYPASESNKKISVTIQLSVRVNIKGEVDSVMVINNPTGIVAFENSAKQAAYSCRYQPAKLGNNAVISWIIYKYEFKMQ